MCVASARGVHHAAVLPHLHMMLRSQGWGQQQEWEQQYSSSSCGSNIRSVLTGPTDRHAAADKVPCYLLPLPGSQLAAEDAAREHMS